MESFQENQLLNVDRTLCYHNLYLWERYHSNRLKKHTLFQVTLLKCLSAFLFFFFFFSRSLLAISSKRLVTLTSCDKHNCVLLVMWRSKLSGKWAIWPTHVRPQNSQHNQPLSDLRHGTEIKAKCLKVLSKSVKFLMQRTVFDIYNLICLPELCGFLC